MKININPGRQNLSIGPVYPDGVDRTAGFLDYYFGADADEAWIEQMMAFDTDVGDQDAALVAAAQAGVAGSWIDRGRILPQERLLADFQRYVHAACAGEVPGPADRPSGDLAGARPGQRGDLARRLEHVPVRAGELELDAGSPQSRWVSCTCGPAGPAAYLSPHSISATSTGYRSSPFWVSRYSCRLRWPRS